MGESGSNGRLKKGRVVKGSITYVKPRFPVNAWESAGPGRISISVRFIAEAIVRVSIPPTSRAMLMSPLYSCSATPVDPRPACTGKGMQARLIPNV